MDLFLASIKPAEREEADKKVQSWKAGTASPIP
jgi:hypothetical protein